MAALSDQVAQFSETSQLGPQPAIVRRSQQLEHVFTALVAVQTELIDPEVDQSNPDYVDHRYASLPSFLLPNRVILQRHGLAVLQFTDGDALVTMLAHTSGQFIEGRTPLLLGSADMPGLGSAISYARRYGYQSILGLVQMDDDGRAAVGARGKASGSAAAVTGAAAPAAKTSGFSLQATVDAIKKKTLISELDVALSRVRSLFSGADLISLEAAITDRRAEIVATSAAVVS